MVKSDGDSTEKGNILGVQAFMTPIDYASEANFRQKIEFYLIEAKKNKWLISERTIVVFPEYIGTFLVAANEKESLYQAKTLEVGLQMMVLGNIGKFAKTFISANTGRCQREYR